MSFRTRRGAGRGWSWGSHRAAPSVRKGGLGRAVDARASVDCVPRAGGLRPRAGEERARAGHAGGAERPRDGFSRGQNGSIAALKRQPSKITPLSKGDRVRVIDEKYLASKLRSNDQKMQARWSKRIYTIRTVKQADSDTGLHFL